MVGVVEVDASGGGVLVRCSHNNTYSPTHPLTHRPTVAPTLPGVIVFVIAKGKLKSDALAEGLEMTTWQSRGKWSRRGVKWVLTILLSLYLPITNQCAKIFLCGGNWASEFTGPLPLSVSSVRVIAQGDRGIGYLVVKSLLLLFSFLFFFRPRESRF